MNTYTCNKHIYTNVVDEKTLKLKIIRECYGKIILRKFVASRYE